MNPGPHVARLIAARAEYLASRPVQQGAVEPEAAVALVTQGAEQWARLAIALVRQAPGPVMSDEEIAAEIMRQSDIRRANAKETLCQA